MVSAIAVLCSDVMCTPVGWGELRSGKMCTEFYIVSRCCRGLPTLAIRRLVSPTLI